ncbi:MAG: FmdE family protein [Pyrinomonadaceae bacterium]
MLPTLRELLVECEALHGHICPGQVLGARMALLGCRLTGIDDPKGLDRKKLVVWVEIDRCMTDAISAATGVRLGRRSLKFVDYGKVAATFLNVESERAFRIVALESSRALADQRFSHIPSKKERQMQAYTSASDKDLFKVEAVAVELKQSDLPGRPKSRVTCAECGEGVNDCRESYTGDGVAVCSACAVGGYYRTRGDADDLFEDKLKESLS